MGEYADEIIDDIIDGRRDVRGFLCRRKYAPQPTFGICRECGAECRWLETADGWRLFDDHLGDRHECDEAEREAFLGDDFKPLDDNDNDVEDDGDIPF